jgi:tRNA(fMet)-specific endonuclease VapC
VILLDTNICIHIINARPPAVLQCFRDYRMGEIGLCSVVAAELAYGVAKSGSTRNREALDLFLSPLAILPFDETALSRKATLVTNNIKEFERVPGLQLDNWVPSA